jgi:hypothetical protein
MTQAERTMLLGRRTALHRDIYKFTVAQGEYMPHIKYSRVNNDFAFSTIHGTPPVGNLLYVAASGSLLPSHLSSPFATPLPSRDPAACAVAPTPSLALPDYVLEGRPDDNAPKPVAEPAAKKQKRKRTRRKTRVAAEEADDNGDEEVGTSDDPTDDLSDLNNIENFRLWMPSDIPSDVRMKICSSAALDAEFALLVADLHDSLVNVRKYRALWAAVRSYYKGEFKVGTSSSNTTRKRKEMSTAGEKVNLHKLRYQHAWDAADQLKPGGTWSLTYRRLQSKDIRGPRPGDDMEDLEATGGPDPRPRDHGVGYYDQSWIWRTISDSSEPLDHIRAQWAKSVAVQDRWVEELELVVEEMRRTLASFDWESKRWSGLIGSRRNTTTVHLSAALDAYAERQAVSIRSREEKFARTWKKTLDEAGQTSILPLRYQTLEGLDLPSSPLAAPPLVDVADDTNGDVICTTAEGANGILADGPSPESAVPTDGAGRDSDEDEDNSESLGSDGDGAGYEDSSDGSERDQ